MRRLISRLQRLQRLNHVAKRQNADLAPLRPISPQPQWRDPAEARRYTYAESFYEVYLFWRTSVFLVGWVSAVVYASRRVDAGPHVLLDARRRLGRLYIGSFLTLEHTGHRPSTARIERRWTRTEKLGGWRGSLETPPLRPSEKPIQGLSFRCLPLLGRLLPLPQPLLND
jgi:hypothetical protein